MSSFCITETDSGSIIWPSNSSSSGKSSGKSKSKNSKKKSKKDKKSKSNSTKSKDEKMSSSLPSSVTKDVGVAKDTVVKDTTLEAIESVIRSYTCHSDGEASLDAKMPAPSTPLAKPKLELEHVYGE